MDQPQTDRLAPPIWIDRAHLATWLQGQGDPRPPWESGPLTGLVLPGEHIDHEAPPVPDASPEPRRMGISDTPHRMMRDTGMQSPWQQRPPSTVTEQ